MIDGIIKADGTSRLMRADLPATYEELRAQAAAGTLPLDVLFNGAGWSQLPTFLNKANLLSDDTAAQYGLEGVVPNDIFSWLGKYNEHWWSLLHGEAYSYYTEKRTKITERVDLIANMQGNGHTISYSKSISINESTGAVSLVDPTSLPFHSIATGLTIVQTLTQQAPCYMYANCYNGTFGPYYIPAGATYREYPGTNNDGYTTTFTQNTEGSNAGYGRIYINPTTEAIRASTVSSQIVDVPAGETTYAHSTDRDAYPDSGTVDGITYSYLGVPFEKFPTLPRIVTGSYTGTGTSGSGNQNALTFDGDPLIVFVGGEAYFYGLAQSTRTKTIKPGHSSLHNTALTWGTNSLSWYDESSDASFQCNTGGVTYYYAAIVK